MPNLSGPEYAVLLVLYVAMGALAYYLAEMDRRNLGRSPWGIPPIVWAVIWFVSPLVGLVLWLFAHRSEVRRAAQAPYVPMEGPVAVAPQPVRASASDFPAYPRPADGGRRDAPPPPNPPPTPVAPRRRPAPGHEASPPAWHPDPSGRYHYRWWTGSEWTSYVSTHGRVEVDTSPDQRIGPY